MHFIGLLAGLCLFYIAFLGIKHGTIRGKNGLVGRAEHPRHFWIVFSWYVLAGSLIIFGGFSQLPEVWRLTNSPTSENYPR